MAGDAAADLRRLTALMVVACLNRNPVPADAVPDLITRVHATLKSFGQAPATVHEAPAVPAMPAVPVRKSVRPDAIVCLECGQVNRMLRRHLEVAHGLTPAAYRARWSLPANYPMVAPEYAATRSAIARQLGLGRPRRRP